MTPTTLAATLTLIVTVTAAGVAFAHALRRSYAGYRHLIADTAAIRADTDRTRAATAALRARNDQTRRDIVITRAVLAEADNGGCWLCDHTVPDIAATLSVTADEVAAVTARLRTDVTAIGLDPHTLSRLSCRRRNTVQPATSEVGQIHGPHPAD